MDLVDYVMAEGNKRMSSELRKHELRELSTRDIVESGLRLRLGYHSEFLRTWPQVGLGAQLCLARLRR